MPSLGPAEILVVLVIALLVFGPNKMPDIAKQVGKGFREFRRVQQHLFHADVDGVTSVGCLGRRPRTKGGRDKGQASRS